MGDAGSAVSAARTMPASVMVVSRNAPLMLVMLMSLRAIEAAVVAAEVTALATDTS